MTTHPNDRDWDRLDALVDEDPIALRDAAWRLTTALAAEEAELESWMARAYEAEKRAWQAEKRLAAWMEHWNATARAGAVDEVAAVLEANARADQAEARIRHLEATAQVLVKEALDAENARDESRRGKGEAEARIKAAQHLIDQADEMGEWAITCTRLQWAIDGSAPRPSA